MTLFWYASSCSLSFHDMTSLHPLSFHRNDFSTCILYSTWCNLLWVLIACEPCTCVLGIHIHYINDVMCSFHRQDCVCASPMNVPLVLFLHWGVYCKWWAVYMNIIYVVHSLMDQTIVLRLHMYLRKLKGVGKESLVHTNVYMSLWDSYSLNTHCYNDISYQTPVGEIYSVTGCWVGSWWCSEGSDRERSWCRYSE